jgi:periplasmic protein TonB
LKIYKGAEMNTITMNYDLNEIIFRNKNRDYGAYNLRKFYKKYLAIALVISIVFFSLLTAGPMIYAKLLPEETHTEIVRKVVSISNLAPPPSIENKEEVVEVVQAPPPLKSTIKFLPPVVKPDEQVKEEYIPTVQELHNVDPGTTTQAGVAGGYDYSLLEVEQPAEEIIEKKEEPFNFVQEMPSYPGGNRELLKFISENMEYPEIARRAGVSGRVIVRCIVEKDGSLSDIEIVKGIGAGCDEEAVRVCGIIPKWNPGRQNTRPVRVRLMIPFQFILR